MPPCESVALRDLERYRKLDREPARKPVIAAVSFPLNSVINILTVFFLPMLLRVKAISSALLKFFCYQFNIKIFQIRKLSKHVLVK